MAIIRGLRPADRFAQISNAALSDTRLSYRARGVLAYLLSRPIGWRTSAENLANTGAEGRDAIRTALNELETHGYLIREKQQGPDGRWSTDVYVYDDPQEQPAITDDGFPGLGTDDGFPVVGKPAVGSPAVGFPGPIRKKETKKERGGKAVITPAQVTTLPVASPAPPKSEFRPKALTRPDRCPVHQDEDDAPPCRPCKDARVAWESGAEERAREEKHRAARAEADAIRERRRLELIDVLHCRMCDDDGRVNGRGICYHLPEADEITTRGAEAAREALKARRVPVPA